MMLTITGKGFSKVLSENTVTVMDNVCDIKSSTFTEIVCEMPPFDAPTELAYIGHRGLKRYFWNNTNLGFAALDGIVQPDHIFQNFDAETMKNT